MTHLLGVDDHFKSDMDGLYLHRKQAIPTAYLDFLKDRRATSTQQREGEMMHVASVPAVLVDKWLAQGIPFYQLTSREIIHLLYLEGADHFIATRKSV